MIEIQFKISTPYASGINRKYNKETYSLKLVSGGKLALKSKTKKNMLENEYMGKIMKKTMAMN